MPLYEGETLKEAIQKAVRGGNNDASADETRRNCDELAGDFSQLHRLVEAHERHVQTLDRHLRSLRGEFTGKLAWLVVDILAIGLPIARLIRLRRMLRAAENAIAAYRA